MEAAQQIQQTETAAAAVDAEPTDADLIAAAQEVGGAASVDVDAEAAAAAAKTAAAASPLPNGAVSGETAADPEEPKIAAVLRAREKAFAERQEANDYAAQRRQRADEEAAKVLADARTKAAADYEADLAARRARFHESPGQAIRELGFKPDDIVDGVTQEGTATFRAIRAAEARAAAAEAKANGVDSVKSDFDAFRKQIIQREQAQEKLAVEQRFLTEFAPVEKAPYLHKRYDAAEIIEKAHALANKWNAAEIPFAHSDIAEYLEHQARQRLAGVPVPPQQVSGGGSAQKVRANGSRTLSAANGSERRASPKPIDEMSPEEERAALIEAAAEARRTGG